MTVVNPNLFECKYCHRTFVREHAYLKHKCKQMDREQEIQTPVGQAAWSFYGEWLKKQRRLVPGIKKFMSSKFYGAFIRFAKFSQELKIADPHLFIQMMVDKNMPPSMWTADQAFTMYLEYIDRNASPMDQIKISLKTLMKISEAAECEIEEVFEVLHPNEILQLIRERKLTPWLLLNSQQFKKMLIRINPEQRKFFEDLVRPEYWMYKFKKDPQTTAKMKEFVAELNI